MSAPNENLVRRLKALHEMSKRGGSENEMTMAAQRLAIELARYNLDHSILEEGHPVKIISKQVEAKYNETWRKSVYHSAAELYMCHYFYTQTRKKNVPLVHNIVGEEQNVAVAAEMGGYFEQTVNRLGNEASRQRKDITGESHTDRHRLIRSFRLAASDRLRARVLQHVAKAKAGTLQITDDTGNEMRLPALQSLYEQQEALYEAYLKEHGISLGDAVVARDQLLSGVGAAMGRVAADKIAFTTQITSDSARFALPKN